jgi:hypothetical protein
MEYPAMSQSGPISRRRFHSLAGSAVAMSAASALAEPPEAKPAPPSVEAAAKSVPPNTIKCFCCDLNWVRPGRIFPAAAHNWAFIDPQEYFDYHREFGNDVTFCQAYTFGGIALYSTKLGPLAPGPGSQDLPRLWALSRQAKMPLVSYMCVGADLVMTTFFGRVDGVCDPRTWKTGYARGCDLFAYAFGAPPNFRPLPVYSEGLKVVSEAFRAIP